MGKAYNKRFRELHPELTKTRQRKLDLRKKFGLTPAEVDNLIAKQNGVCCLCKQSETAKSSSGGGIRRLSIDHCHATGKIRGALCYRCNYVLGLCKDNIQLLRDMALYIELADTGYRTTPDQPEIAEPAQDKVCS